MITFTVPGQPVGKGRPRIGRVDQHARMFTPAKTANYEGLVAHAAGMVMNGRPLLEGAVQVQMLIHCQIPASWSKKKQQQALVGEVFPTTKPDIDNIEKAVYDAINGVVWKDDVQVVDVVKRKRYAASPGVIVTVAPAAPVAAHQQGDLQEVA